MASGSKIVLMAPREIVDLVYRACRAQGHGAGISNRCAANVTHAQVHRGDGISSFLATFDQGPEVAQAFVAAADALEAAEADRRTTIEFDQPIAIAAISDSLWHAAGRGFSASTLADTLDGTSLLSEITFEHGARTDERDIAAAERHRKSLREGVPVENDVVLKLEALAARFLVHEATVDAAVLESLGGRE